MTSSENPLCFYCSEYAKLVKDYPVNSAKIHPLRSKKIPSEAYLDDENQPDFLIVKTMKKSDF